MNQATSDQLCTLLDQMIWARSAAQHVRPRRPVRLHALPPTMWVRPGNGTGGHKASVTGALPATVTWHEGALRTASPSDSTADTANWTVNAAGTHLAGAIELTEGRAAVGRPARSMWPAHRAPVLTAFDAARRLDELEEHGEMARWSMLEHLEQFAHEKVHAVTASICREITGIDDDQAAPRLLDDEQLNVVITNVLYGRTGPDSRILRCLDRCLDPATTRNVDPIRYLTTQIRRDLGDEVRVAIGDPQVGSRVRRIARDLGTGAGLEEIISRYNDLHRSDRISTSRAIRALTVAPSIDSLAVRNAFEVQDA